MYKSKSPPLVRLLVAVLALLAFGAVSLQAEDVFVTSYLGTGINVSGNFAYGTGISGFGTSSVGSASPAPPTRSRAMYGYQLGTNAWVSTTPTLATSGPGSWYKIYVLRGTDGNAPSDIIVNITTPDGTLLDTSGNVQTTIPSTAFRAGSGAVNAWLFVGTITNLTTTTPTITWAYASGTQSATGGRCYFDAFRFFYNDPCAIYTQVGISGAVYAGQTVVNVSGVVAGATSVRVFADGSPIGTATAPAGFPAGTVAVAASALVKDTILKAQQSKDACTSGMPGSGPMVGGGANPKIRVSLGCWKNAAWTGPIGTNAPSGFTSSYFVKATGLVNNYGTAPLGGQELLPSQCWQEVTFNQQVDSCLDQSSSLIIVNTDAYCALESLTFAIDDTDSGPYDIYVDKIMNGTNIIENFEGRAGGTGVTLNNPSVASVPNAGIYYNISAINSSLVSTNQAFDGTNSCRVQWQFSDNLSIRWAHVLANQATGKTYPELDVKQPVTVRFLVLPAGVTTAHKFNGTVSAITNSTPVYQGGSVELGVTVTGSGSYTYQWSDSGGPIGSATDRTYTNSSLSLSELTVGPYSVAVSDGTCSASPSAVLLNLAPPLPIITNQPVSMVVNVGSAAPLTVGAMLPLPEGITGALTYQWELITSTATNNVGGATTSALGDAITSAQLTDTGYYDVIVSDIYGSITSSIVSLQVVGVDVVIGNGNGLRGDYFNLPTWSGEFAARSWAGTPTLTRKDPTINFDWLTASPAPGTITVDDFAVRWYGQIQPPISDTYEFTARCDDGVRVWIDKQLVVDYWHPQAATDRTGSITLNTSKHDILMEYFERGSYASAKLYWTNAGGTIAKTFVPLQQLYANKSSWTPPTVTLTGPAHLSSVTLPAPVIMSATVVTNDGIVKSVEFYTNSVLLTTVTTPPYTYSWTAPAAGSYPISAHVVYNESSRADSADTNSVTVITLPPPAAVTISNISGTTITYGGGGGTRFVLMRFERLNVPLSSWTRVATNTATPGTFTIPAVGTPDPDSDGDIEGMAFYIIKSE